MIQLAVVNGGAARHWTVVICLSGLRNGALITVGFLTLEEVVPCLVGGLIKMRWLIGLHWGVASVLLELRVIH